MPPRARRSFFYMGVAAAVLLWAGLAINLIRRTDIARSGEWIFFLAVAIAVTWSTWHYHTRL
ncbi:MAG: hypothetical protein KGM47_00645 [Acidobacteriota bacterium]|nr:hypothetical protein [Acidobacteriota bacterium]